MLDILCVAQCINVARHYVLLSVLVINVAQRVYYFICCSVCSSLMLLGVFVVLCVAQSYVLLRVLFINVAQCACYSMCCSVALCVAQGACH